MMTKPDFSRGTFGTEDENNNWIIECYLMMKEWDKPKVVKPLSEISAIGGPTVTITITKENYTDNESK